MAKHIEWIYQYKCGCTSGPAPKEVLPTYCPTHGKVLLNKYPVDASKT